MINCHSLPLSARGPSLVVRFCPLKDDLRTEYSNLNIYRYSNEADRGLPKTSQQTQNICITFIQCRPKDFNVSPTLYKCHTNVLCLIYHNFKSKKNLRSLWFIHQYFSIVMVELTMLVLVVVFINVWIYLFILLLIYTNTVVHTLSPSFKYTSKHEYDAQLVKKYFFTFYL